MRWFIRNTISLCCGHEGVFVFSAFYKRQVAFACVRVSVVCRSVDRVLVCNEIKESLVFFNVFGHAFL